MNEYFYSETEYAFRIREDFHKVKPNLYDHLHAFCKRADIRKSDLTTPTRTSLHVRYRAMFCGYVYRGEDKPSLKEIGNLLGGRHHATILNSLESHRQFMQEKSYRNEFNYIIKE